MKQSPKKGKADGKSNPIKMQMAMKQSSGGVGGGAKASSASGGTGGGAKASTGMKTMKRMAQTIDMSGLIGSDDSDSDEIQLGGGKKMKKMGKK